MEEPVQRTDREVCFVRKVRAMLVESRADFSKKERKQTWYSKEELRSIELRCLREAARWESGDVNKRDRRLCSRGLEGYTAEGITSISVVVDACIDAVISEQENQYENDCDEDCNRLAIVSQEVSKQCINEAIARATRDEKVARKIYRVDQQKKRLSPPKQPKRRVSRDNNLSSTSSSPRRDMISSMMLALTDLDLLEDPTDDVIINPEGRGRAKKDCTCGPGSIAPMDYPKLSTFSAKSA